jgi:hypothetical protein
MFSLILSAIKAVFSHLMHVFHLNETAQSVFLDRFKSGEVTHYLEGFGNVSIGQMQSNLLMSQAKGDDPKVLDYFVRGAIVKLYISSITISNMDEIRKLIRDYILTLEEMHSSPTEYISALREFIQKNIIEVGKFDNVGFTIGIVVRIGNRVAFKTIGNVMAWCIENRDGKNQFLFKTEPYSLVQGQQKLINYEESQGTSSHYRIVAHTGFYIIKNLHGNAKLPYEQLGMSAFSELFNPDKQINEIELSPGATFMVGLGTSIFFLSSNAIMGQLKGFSQDNEAFLNSMRIGENVKHIAICQLNDLLVGHMHYLAVMVLQILKQSAKEIAEGSYRTPKENEFDKKMLGTIGSIRRHILNHTPSMQIIVKMIKSSKSAEITMQLLEPTCGFSDQEIADAIYKFDPNLPAIFDIEVQINRWITKHPSLMVGITTFETIEVAKDAEASEVAEVAEVVEAAEASKVVEAIEANIEC